MKLEVIMSSIKDIGIYKVVFPLRKGTYYDVYRVVDSSNNKFFLKLINLAKLDDMQLEPKDGHVSELKIMHGLSHANILSQLDSGETIVNGQRYAYSVSKFVSGELLSEKILREGVCSVYEVKQIITGVLNGLKYLHSQPTPIIHNGISQASIMLDMSNSVPIALMTDFGHARLLDKENRKCYMSGLSPFYLAPEMFKGLYSTRTDLYAVGALMYHLIYGMQPWQIELKEIPSKDKEQAILSARKRPLPIPNMKVFELDENMFNIIAKSLMQDVDERFQSADEFLKAIEGEIQVDCPHYEKFDVTPIQQPSKASVVQNKKGNGFADVAGLESLKQRLQEEVIDILRNPNKYKRLRVKNPNGILLYGPPGCGKTFVAEKFAEELGCNYIYVHCSDVASPYIHGGQEKIAALFQQAKENAPTVLFLDELDAMLTDRSRHTNVSESGEVNEFLTQLNNCGENGVIVVGATNKPTMIDPAALRSGRLEIKVYVPAPSEEEREQLFKLSLTDIAAPDVDFKLLAAKTKGYVSKDICVLVNKAAMIAARQDDEVIKMATILSAIEKSKGELPSVSESELKKHEQIRDEFESKNNIRRPIGFNVPKE